MIHLVENQHQTTTNLQNIEEINKKTIKYQAKMYQNLDYIVYKKIVLILFTNKKDIRKIDGLKTFSFQVQD